MDIEDDTSQLQTQPWTRGSISDTDGPRCKLICLWDSNKIAEISRHSRDELDLRLECTTQRIRQRNVCFTAQMKRSEAVWSGRMTGPIEVIMIHGCLCATADCVTADIVLALRVYCLFYKFIKGITAYTKELRGFSRGKFGTAGYLYTICMKYEKCLCRLLRHWSPGYWTLLFFLVISWFLLTGLIKVLTLYLN